MSTFLRALHVTFLATATATAVVACGSADPATSTDPWTNTSMQAIVANKCALSGCHDGHEKPTFTSIAESAMKAEREALSEVTSGKMPKSGSLTAAEKQTFIDFYK